MSEPRAGHSLRLLALTLICHVGLAQQIRVGSVLVATRKSHDPDLARSVVLLIHSDRDGVIGLILNRPIKYSYFGGPIALGVRCLVRSRTRPAGAEHIVGDVYLTASPVGNSARTYAGYTGWSIAQLTDELALGLWKVLPGAAGIVFDRDPSTLWPRLLR